MAGFEKAVRGLPDDFICLVVTTSANYQQVNLEILKYMTKDPRNGIYVTTNKPHERLVADLRREGVNIAKLAFIDTITLKVGGAPNEDAKCIYLEDVSNLTNLSIAINRLVSQLPGDDFLLLDSLSTLLLYNTMNNVARFFHFMSGRMRMWKTKGIFISIKKDEEGPLMDALAPFCDKVIDLSKTAEE